MSRAVTTHIRLLVLVTGLTFCCRVLYAADAVATRPDTSQWTCTLCPPAARATRIETKAGAAYVSDSAARFGDYRGLEQRGSYLILGGAFEHVGADGLRIAASAEDVGLSSRELQVVAEWPERLSLALEYRTLPRYLSDSTLTPFRLNGEVSTLPADWVSAGATTGMTRLAASAQREDLEFDSDTLQAASSWQVTPRLTLSLDYRRDERSGRDDITAAFVNLGVQIPLPIDDRTDTVTATLGFDHERGGGRLQYLGSLYTNHLAALSWQNPFTPVVSGTNFGQLALAPDNSLHQLQGSWLQRIGNHSRVAINASVGEAQQDKQFLPYTTNPFLAVGLPPRARLDGKVGTSHIGLRWDSDLRLLGRFWRGARLVVDARRDDRDNSVSRAVFERVEGDSFVATPTTNTPYDFIKQSAVARIDYDLRELLTFIPGGQRLILSGAWRYDSFERPQREVVSARERSGWGRVAYTPWPWLRTQLELGGGLRETGRLRADVATAVGQNPLLRKYDLADRERQYADFSLAITPATDWSLLLTMQYSSNDFVNSRIGLTSSRDSAATIAVHKAISPRMAFDARYGWDRRKARQLGSQAFASPDWSATTDDRSRIAGAGFRLDNIGRRADLVLDYSYSQSRGRTVTDLGVLPIVEFPALRHRTRSLSASVDYHYSSRLTLQAELVSERYDADDFLVDGVGLATMPTFLTLGGKTLDYDLQYAALSFRYIFDGEARATR